MNDRTKSYAVGHSFARLSELGNADGNILEIPVSAKVPASESGHGGADERMLAEFIDCVRTGRTPELDVNFAIRMSLPGIIAEQSYKSGNAALDIPKV